MSPLLSVLLPVHNAQATLSWLLADLLEVLPDLTSRFEVLVIDEGSTDATWEVAQDWAGKYPQVQVVRQAGRHGRLGLRPVLSRLEGELVLLCDEGCQLDLRDLHKLWRNREAFDCLLAWPADASHPSGESFALRMRAWRLRLAGRQPGAAQPAGYQLLGRRSLEALRGIPADRYELLAELSRLGHTWQIVEVRAARHAALASAIAARPSSRSWQPVRVDDSAPDAAMPSAKGAPSPAASRPKYLGKLRDFALGE